jgi:hypothetical protein
MNKLLVVAALATAALCVGTGANAAVIFNMDSPTGTLGTSQSYTSSGLTVTASGFNQFNSAIDLYGKNNGGDETGLGLSNDSTGEHEIEFDHGYVQLNVSALFGHVSSLGFLTGSTTDGEEWAVYGSNTSGVCGSGYSISTGACGTALIKGTTEDQSTNVSLPDFGTFKYYDFVEISHVNAWGQTDNNDNILLSSLTAGPIPEPATWAMFLVGFGGVGFMMRGARRKDAAAAV